MDFDGNDAQMLDAAIREAEVHLGRLKTLRASIMGETAARGPTPGVQVMEWWNALARELGLPGIRAWTQKRQRHLTARSKSDLWNLAEIEQRVRTLKDFAFDGWFNLDWFLKSETNLAKLLEGNYSNDRARKRRPQHSTPSAEESVI